MPDPFPDRRRDLVDLAMAHRFDKSTAFGVLGLVFFLIIGIPIPAFGQADYDAARELG